MSRNQLIWAKTGRCCCLYCLPSTSPRGFPSTADGQLAGAGKKRFPTKGRRAVALHWLVRWGPFLNGAVQWRE